MFDDDMEYYDLWNDMDELLIMYPELSELWLDRDKLSSLRNRWPSKDDLREYFRKRAFTSMVMEKIFRIFESSAEAGPEDSDEGEEETITIDNPELIKIWSDDVKDEYADYPEFIQYVKDNVFK